MDVGGAIIVLIPYRYLFSMERNRRIFKKLLPPNIFALFIDVGHYTRPLSAYTALVQVINSLPVRLYLNITMATRSHDLPCCVGE